MWQLLVIAKQPDTSGKEGKQAYIIKQSGCSTANVSVPCDDLMFAHYCYIVSLKIDGSTLRTICMQHGPLLTFHLGLTQGSALIRYSSQQEAVKAQGALHM